jgi:hypothetical protein
MIATDNLNPRQLQCLSVGECPDCGCTIFRPGPRGGLAQNIECVNEKCLARFNVAHYESHMVTAQRIPREREGGGEWREDMFPRVLE